MHGRVVHVREELRQAVPVAEPRAIVRSTTVDATVHPGYLFHPLIDFLLAGGGSLLVAAPVIWLVRDKVSAYPTAVSLSFGLSLVVNYPHFAHSYQLLYSGIGHRIFSSDHALSLRLKYVWAGFVAPLLIAGFLVAAFVSGNARVLGYAANAFWFTTGWHYVKQGYGVVTVLSAIRRIYFSKLEKKIFLLNGYAVWIYSWMAMNVALHEQTFMGVRYFTFALPSIVVTIGRAAAIVTTAALVITLLVRLARRQPVSWNGIVGYLSSLYLWVIAFNADPIFTLFVPAFHSLQYMLFVWRYQLNKVAAKEEAVASQTRGSGAIGMQLARFVLAGIVLGFIGFIALPAAFQSSVSSDPAIWGPTVFTFMFVAWINLHHYFIDNVIWRRDNEDVRRFLFAPR